MIHGRLNSLQEARTCNALAAAVQVPAVLPLSLGLTFPTMEAKVLEQLEDVFKADKQKDGE